MQQARVNALATQFDKLGPDLRAPALAALHGRCKGSEKASLVQLYYKERTLAASERGAAAARGRGSGCGCGVGRGFNWIWVEKRRVF